jgi:hypothetical protein
VLGCWGCQVGEAAFAELRVASSGALGARAQAVLWPALGGLATGCVALAYPEVLYQVGLCKALHSLKENECLLGSPSFRWWIGNQWHAQCSTDLCSPHQCSRGPQHAAAAAQQTSENAAYFGALRA